MSTRTQRGRSTPTTQRGRNVPTKKRSLLPIFLIVGLTIVVGIVIAVVNLNNTAAPGESAIPADQAIRDFNAPVGQTDEGYWYKGDPEAPVTVIEYADFQCPGCGAFFRNQEHSITQQYVESGQVQFVYHELPLSQHRNAIPAALAARCAGDQGQFWPMHDLIFARQGEWSNDTNTVPRFSRYAQELELDQAAFDECVSSGQYTEQIQAAGQAAAEAGARATPTFSVNGELVDASQLQTAIDAALQH